MGHQSYVLLCTETTLSNPPVVQPKSSCDVHLLRSPCLSTRILRQFDAYDMSMKYLNDDSYEANFHLAFGHITGYNLTPGNIKTDFPKYICYIALVMSLS